MSEIFYAGMIPFYLDVCVCIPGVMGSGDWEAPFEGPMTYDSGGDFYWNDFGGQGPEAMFWPTASSGFQSIEVTVTNFGPLEDGGDVLALYCRSTDISDESAGLQFWVRKYEEAVEPTGPYWEWFTQADGDILTESGTVAPWPYGDIGDETTFLLESDVDGSFRAYVNGVLLTSGVDLTQSAGTTQVGWYVDRYAAGDETTSVHVSDICVKLCGELGLACIPDVMDSGAWIEVDTDPDNIPMLYEAPYYRADSDTYSTMLWPTAFSNTQSIEVTIENFGLPSGGSTTSDGDQIMLVLRQPGQVGFFRDGPSVTVSLFKYSAANTFFDPGWQLEVSSNPSGDLFFNADMGFDQSISSFTFRAESDVDGAWRAYFNGSMVASGTDAPYTGATNVGVMMSVMSVGPDYVADSPRITDICIKGE